MQDFSSHLLGAEVGAGFFSRSENLASMQDFFSRAENLASHAGFFFRACPGLRFMQDFFSRACHFFTALSAMRDFFLDPNFSPRSACGGPAAQPAKKGVKIFSAQRLRRASSATCKKGGKFSPPRSACGGPAA